ncbi:hypothetical protein OAS16_05430 [Candidatus Pelagibacter sp.]|nr:hypothetical protein [Candidatus Pelagibacter sp.]
MINLTKFNNISNYNIYSILLIFLVIILKLLFYFSGFILEDSFIVFRSAFNFADFNNFSFNLDETNHTGVTSKVFGLICYIIRIIFGDYASLVIILFNSILSLFASMIFYISFRNLINENNDYIEKNFLLLFVLLCNPAILIIGITGLEYALVIFFMSLSFLYIFSNYNNYYLLLGSALLPATRFELIAVNLIFIFVFFIYRDRKWFYLLVFSILGLVLNFSLNFYFDNTIFPSSAISKWMTLSKTNHYELKNIFEYFSIWFLYSKSFFLGVTSKYVPNIIYFLISVMILFFVFKKFLYFNIFKYKLEEKKYRITLLICALSIFFVPLSYVIAGHAFSWYFFPFSYLTYVFLTIIFINSQIYKPKYIKFCLTILISLICFQFLILKNIGFQENTYRSHVGQFINEDSTNKDIDTLFLEPAGYIPYFAKIKTFDTVGLTSPLIREYRKKDKIKNWWFNFIYNEKPIYIVERRDVSFDGNVRDGNYVLTKDELKWFRNNYKKIKTFKYSEYIEKYGGAFKSFYRLGSHSDYYVFKIKS